MGTAHATRRVKEPVGAPSQIEGRRPVLEALRAGRPLRRLLVARGERHGLLLEIIRLAREQGIRIEEVPPADLERRARTRVHQGVVALAAAEPPVDVANLLARARQRGEAPLLLIAAGIQDPQNLGSLIRSAEAAGAHGVVIPRHRAAGLTPAVAKAAAGALAHLPVAEAVNLSQTIEMLKKEGLWVCGADPGAETSYHEADLGGPLALVVGSEGRGMPRLVRETCDFLVRIPMAGRVASLNAAVAGAILMFEAQRQRRAAGRRG